MVVRWPTRAPSARLRTGASVPRAEQSGPDQTPAGSTAGGSTHVHRARPPRASDATWKRGFDLTMVILMSRHLDDVPFSGIIRLRDMMYTVDRPFRLDQGDVSFDAPDSVKQGLIKGVHDNRSHYVQTTGIPPLLDLLVAKMRDKNGIPIGGTDEVMVTSGGIHGVFAVWQGLLERGDEVLVPDPEWPPAQGNVACARAVTVGYPLHESLGWQPDVEEMRQLITPKTRAIYLTSPNNPTGGVLGRPKLDAIAALARERNLWVISDEAYEDVVFDGTHVSIASLPGMYERTIPLYTSSKTYAMTGLRLGYIAVKEPTLRERVRKML